MVPDISIRIKTSQLEALLTVLNFENDRKTKLANLEPPIRAAVSILVPLSRKLTTKLHNLQKKDNASKQYKLTFDYHQAYALYSYLHNCVEAIPYGYERTACYSIHMDLNQLLQ
jgi:hypothetical protein